MRLKIGTPVDCADGRFGKLVDVVIDPTARRLTHLVVESDRERWLARLVPVELAKPGDGARPALVLDVTLEELRRLPQVHETSYLRLDGFPVEDPDWDVGIEEVFALPYYAAYDLEPAALDFAVAYDRIPKREVEVRRTSPVESADGHRLGQVGGFFVDRNDLITHLLLEQGPPWERREVAVPIGAVARIENDAATLSLTKDEVTALPRTDVRHWPRPLELGRSRG